MVQICDNDEVHEFLQKHFLHWFEALSLMNRISEVIEQLDKLQSLVSVSESTHVTAFLEDARRIFLSNRYIVDLAPLQIYSSAMIFAPQTSVVRKVCGRIPSWLRRCPTTPVVWSPELQTLEGHTDSVNAVAFSHDGSLLASASNDETVRLWNPHTGREIQTLKGPPGIIAVDFSLGDTALRTNQGIMSIDNKFIPCLTFESSAWQPITMNDAWIRQGEHDLLWLPLEYRRSPSAFYGNTIAIGLRSGQVGFIQLDYLEVSDVRH
ncbi:uncharacterized protein Z518_06790 [Rhinocladiella mackenziei CBS 650.93]|uniref:Uncharacterized protein n=1 Tax=Rhinocladiella mackenziei CBS 650.93 TaxID=1442369 RepID=A0A0D2GYE7_9EURO|nr:uncharacterized protein Z518_06790 [Rhinocladiella mackenziei CBS 650.93]KIX03238.1 hypothetical protein Z518_06790 [Rhinocladiella mackenziei CBS 650.93]